MPVYRVCANPRCKKLLPTDKMRHVTNDEYENEIWLCEECIEQGWVIVKRRF